MNTNQEQPIGFCLVQDDGNHWYVCPADKVEAAQNYFNLMSDYWNRADNDETPMPQQPKGLVGINNPKSLVFQTWSVK